MKRDWRSVRVRDKSGELERRIAVLEAALAALVRRTDHHDVVVSAIERAAEKSQ